MADKDAAEKILEELADVFADILNVLLFNGEQVVKPEDLIPATVRSQYKITNTLREQERDVGKFWMNNHIRIAMYGFENQTAVDPDMPLRCLGYDGTEYRRQMAEDYKVKGLCGKKHTVKRPRYPVITLVLYFGLKPWKKPTSLHSMMNINEKLLPYVNNYKMNLFQIAYLTPEQVNMFKSDFKIVADYFVQMRMNEKYIPSPETITHVQEICQLMSILTKDNRFEKAATAVLKNNAGGAFNMCNAFDEAEARGEARGISIGEARGISIGEARGELRGILKEKINSARNFINSGLATIDQLKETGMYTADELAAIAKP